MLHAFIDESGNRGLGPSASDHFVITAVIVRDRNLPRVSPLLETLRADVNRPQGGYLSWKNIRSHGERLHISRSLGAERWMRVATVVACKRHLPNTSMNASQLYLYQLRFLLERLSWLARDEGEVLTYTMAHIKGFKLSELRHYEAMLRTMQDCRIEWSSLDPSGGSIDQPQRVDELQLADMFASATGTAFNLDRFANTEQRYLQEIAPLLYRRGSSAVTSYGLKMHPWNEATRAAYPWVAAL